MTLTVYVDSIDSAVRWYYGYKDAEIIFYGKNLAILKYKGNILRFEFWPEEDSEEPDKTQWEKTKSMLSLFGIKKDD